MKMFKIAVLILVLLLITAPLWAQVVNTETLEEVWRTGFVVVLNAVLPALILGITRKVSSKTYRFLIAAGGSLILTALYFIIAKVPVTGGNIIETFTLGFSVAQIAWRTYFSKLTNSPAT